MTELSWQNHFLGTNTLVDESDLKPYLDEAEKFLNEVCMDNTDSIPPFISHMADEQELDELTKWGQKLREQNDQLIILGTGGSSRGGQSICVLKKRNNYDNHTLRPFFFENIGAHSMDKLTTGNDLSKTHFLVISKSGSTSEILAQCIVFMRTLDEKYPNLDKSKHFTVISDDNPSPLTKLAKENGFKIFNHPKNLGGRYSVLSVVGMAPAIASGVDVKLLLEGAKDVFTKLSDGNTPIMNKQAAIGAATQAFLYKEKNISQTVLMAYDTRFVPFTRWFQQLWAESVGKNEMGTTPIIALGPIDQHSQLQLYLQGPTDKFFTILIESVEGQGPEICSDTSLDFGLDYLAGNTIGDLVVAEASATIKTLQENNRPVRVINCPKIDENSIGRLLAHFMMETIIFAHLIGVNPYDQPAVERGKQLTKEYLKK